MNLQWINPWLMRLFHMQIWILCKLFNHVLESPSYDIKVFPCLCISVKETALVTNQFIRLKVLPTVFRLCCGTRSPQSKKTRLWFYSLYLPPPDHRKSSAWDQAVLAAPKPLPTTANWGNLNPENVEPYINACQYPKGKYCNHKSAMSKETLIN